MVDALAIDEYAFTDRTELTQGRSKLDSESQWNGATFFGSYEYTHWVDVLKHFEQSGLSLVWTWWPIMRDRNSVSLSCVWTQFYFQAPEAVISSDQSLIKTTGDIFIVDSTQGV